MQIISADERLRERRGAKVLIVGPTGVGKTWQLRNLDPAKTLFIDIEAGDLAVLDLPVPTIRPDELAIRARSGVSDRRSAQELPAHGLLFAGALRGNRWCARAS